MRGVEAEARVRAVTHAFQSIRPPHPEAEAVCARCHLVLPRGPVLSIGPGGLPDCFDCFDAPPPQDNSR